MAHLGTGSGHSGRGARVLAAALVFGALVAAPAIAQQKKEQPKAAAPAAAPAAKDAGKAGAGKDAAAVKDAAAAGKQSDWVKLCDKASVTRKDKDGKETKDEKNICTTLNERLDANTGMTLSAGIIEVDGPDKERLVVMIPPLNLAVAQGMRAIIHTKEQWAKASKNEKVDEKTLKLIELKYTQCNPGGCAAEAEATKELIDQMKNGGGIVFLAVNVAAQPLVFAVPLEGFTEAMAGKPIDNQEYAKARGQALAQVRQRQAQLMEQYKKEQEAKQAAGGTAGAPPAGAPTAPAAAAPAAPAAKGAEKKK